MTGSTSDLKALDVVVGDSIFGPSESIGHNFFRAPVWGRVPSTAATSQTLVPAKHVDSSKSDLRNSRPEVRDFRIYFIKIAKMILSARNCFCIKIDVLPVFLLSISRLNSNGHPNTVRPFTACYRFVKKHNAAAAHPRKLKQESKLQISNSKIEVWCALPMTLSALLLLLLSLIVWTLSRSIFPAAEISTLPLLRSSEAVVAWPSLPTPAAIEGIRAVRRVGKGWPNETRRASQHSEGQRDQPL